MLIVKKRKLITPTNFRLDEDEANSNTAITRFEEIAIIMVNYLLYFVTYRFSTDKVENYLIELKIEGCSQAEAGDFRKALNIWQRALQFIIDNEHSCMTIDVATADSDATTPTMRCLLHELKAQAYMELDMLMDAIRGFIIDGDIFHSFMLLIYVYGTCDTEANSAVESCSRWPEGLLTLGRCQREIGEIELSIVTYESLVAILKENGSSSSSSSGGGSITSSSLQLEDVMQEMVEVKSLADELKKRRQLQLKQLQDMPSSATPAEREVLFYICICMLKTLKIRTISILVLKYY